MALDAFFLLTAGDALRWEGFRVQVPMKINL